MCLGPFNKVAEKKLLYCLSASISFIVLTLLSLLKCKQLVHV